jgi:hypothetical protein
MSKQIENEFLPPEKVTAPRLHWSLIKVLINEGPEGYSVALGYWDQNACLAVRWNACQDRPVGNPHSRGLPTWFIIPAQLAEAIIKSFDRETQAFVRKFISA